jgi:hypothetical protein
MEDSPSASVTTDGFLQQAECEPDKEGLSLFDLPNKDNGKEDIRLLCNPRVHFRRPEPKEAVGESIPELCSQFSTRLRGLGTLGFYSHRPAPWRHGVGR